MALRWVEIINFGAVLLGREGASNSGNKQARPCFRLGSVEREVAGFANSLK